MSELKSSVSGIYNTSCNVEIIKKSQIKLEVKSTNCDSVVCLDDDIAIGRENGIIQVNKNCTEFVVKCFNKEFDFLDNEYVKEKIMAIKILDKDGIDEKIFVANEKTIKFFRIREDKSIFNIINDIKITKNASKIFSCQNSCKYRKTPIKISDSLSYFNAHKYLIHSLSTNISQEFLLSSDLLKINMWKIDRMENCYNLVDIKKNISSGSIFVINSTKFSTFNDTIFGYCTSNATIALHDIKISPHSSNLINLTNDSKQNSYSFSDFVFINDNIIASRNLNTVTVFDVRNPTKQILTVKLFSPDINILNSELIYEKFQITATTNRIYTGSLNSELYSINPHDGTLNKTIINTSCSNTDHIKLVHSTKNIINCIGNNVIYRYEECL